jgi:hypothetical protein
MINSEEPFSLFSEAVLNAGLALNLSVEVVDILKRSAFLWYPADAVLN